MGLNAVVMCNCYKDGRTVEPPVSRHLVGLGSNGELTLNVSWENEELHNSFQRWLAAGCEHFLQQYVEVWMGTWGGVRSSQKALRELGADTIADLIPDCNGGEISCVQTAFVLRAIDGLLKDEDNRTEGVRQLTGFLEALRTVCRASQKTGNPVLWR